MKSAMGILSPKLYPQSSGFRKNDTNLVNKPNFPASETASLHYGSKFRISNFIQYRTEMVHYAESLIKETPKNCRS